MNRSDEAGLTLVELTIVFVLATLVMVGLVSFYLSSQATWLDGSTEAQTQREATLLIDAMAARVRASAKAIVEDYPDPFHQMLSLYSPSDTLNASYVFWWDPKDSHVYGGSSVGAQDAIALTTAPTDSFRLEQINASLVELSWLQLRAGTSPVIVSGALFALYNR